MPADLDDASALGVARIRSLIPHAGPMCLLDRVVAWDTAHIRCVATSHHREDNPLRRGGALRAICGVEYAAQAMALHAALERADPAPRRGYLISLRDVHCPAAMLDAVPGPLEVDVEVIAGGAAVVYGFILRAAGEPLLSGRAAVVLEDG
jgi:predicted hotdog family 3-hydroxylacyl-ACP dehydratase